MGQPHDDQKIEKPLRDCDEKKARLTIEMLEARIAPSVASAKKDPVPPPYAPGTLYGLVRRDNLDR